MSAFSPGTIVNFFPNRYSPDRAAYLGAVAAVMQREYEAIVQAGLLLQLSCLSLVSLIASTPEKVRLLQQAEEFEDLFWRLFYAKHHLRMDRLLW